MFPIFRIQKLNANRNNVGVSGTGFFINSKGYFVSATHIFDSIAPEVSYNFLGFLPEKLKTPPLPITEVIKDKQMDIFIGKISMDTPNFFSLKY